MRSTLFAKDAGLTDTILIATTRIIGFQNLRVRLSARQAAESIGNVYGADAGNRELEGSEERGELYQSNRPKAEKTPNCENELRAPSVVEAVIRR